MEQNQPAGKAKLIREYERNFAYRVAAGVIDKPVISVWLILIPFLFVYYVYRIQRYKNDIPAFAEGFGRSKLAALDLALAAALSGRRPEDAGTNLPVDPEKHGLEEEFDPTRPSTLEEARKAEFSLLVKHYGRLLAAPGNDYQALLKAAYRTRAEYDHFLADLQAAEVLVIRTAVAALPDTLDGEAAAARIKDTARQLRQADRGKFYG